MSAGDAVLRPPRERRMKRTTVSAALRRTVPATVAYALLLAGVVVMIVPYYRMLSASVMPLSEVIKIPPVWLPAAPTLGNYVEVISKLNFARFFTNSVIVAVGAVLLTLLTSSLAGYTFAKFRFPGRNVLFVLVLATMMMPFQVRMVPLFLMYSSFGLLDTYVGLIIPHAFNPFGIFLMRQYMHTVPGDLVEAARIDGCSEFAIYWRIVMPLSRPALAALTIFAFNGAWDEFLWPLIIISSTDMRTLPLALARFTEQYVSLTHLQMAGSVITTLPMVLVFFLLQREFVRGIALSGIKG